MKYRDPDTGEFKDITVKASDTLPIGTVVEYDGTEVPSGWEEISPIIESGNNNYGDYIKFKDGTMICRGTVTIPVTTSVWGSLYVCDWTGNISLPSTFINKPTINATSSTNSGAISKVIVTTNAITAISVFRGSEATGVNYPIDYIAIGRWK